MIRAARPDDLAGMLELYRHLNPSDPMGDSATVRQAWAALTGPGFATVLVAERDGLLVSSCTLVVIPNLTRAGRSYALIENVVTHAAHRRAGLGRAVLAAAVERAWEAGCYKVMLATGSQREETLRFYEGAGFARGGKTFFEIRRP